MTIVRVLALAAAASAGCSSPSTEPAPSAAPPSTAAAPAPSAAAPATATLTLIEPADGSFSGHVSLFKWTAASGADGYRVQISTGSGRVVWESPVMAETEAHPPNTVSLEPEPHTWTVSALKGAEVIATSPTFRFTITP